MHQIKTKTATNTFKLYFIFFLSRRTYYLTFYSMLFISVLVSR